MKKIKRIRLKLQKILLETFFVILLLSTMLVSFSHMGGPPFLKIYLSQGFFTNSQTIDFTNSPTSPTFQLPALKMYRPNRREIKSIQCIQGANTVKDV